jgi:hypothetical protein
MKLGDINMTIDQLEAERSYLALTNPDCNTTTDDSLKAAYTVRQNACTKLEHAIQALDRIQPIVNDAKTKVRELEQRRATAESVQAGALADQIAMGGPTDDLIGIDDELELSLFTARSALSIKSKAHVSLQAAHSEALTAFQTAEDAVVVEVDRLLELERQAEVREAIAALDTAVRLAQIVADRIPGGMYTPINLAFVITDDERRLANFLTKVTEADKIHVPVHILNGSRGQRAPDDPSGQRVAEWERRRARLIAGELTPVNESAAA